MDWFMYSSSVIVAVIGLAGAIVILCWIWSYTFDTFLRQLELMDLFKDFIIERYQRRPVGNRVTDEESEQLKRELGR